MPLPFSGITTPLVLHLRNRRATRSTNSLLGVLFECLPRPHVFHHLFVFPFSKLVQRKTFPLAQAATKPLRTARVATSRLGLVATRSNTPHTPRLKQWPKRHGRTSIQSCCLARHGSRHARATLLPAAFDRTGRGFLARSKYPE